MKRIIIGISGASGVVYGIRLLQVLAALDDIETHLVMTPAARRTLILETDHSVEDVEALADVAHKYGDIAACISSGSFRVSGMIVAPCSIKTAAGIASCFSENLLLRSADVILKERRRLVLLVRETPMHLGHLRLLVQLAEMGATIMPPTPAFYHRPTKVEGIIDQTINRALDMLDIPLHQELFTRWRGSITPKATTARRTRNAAPGVLNNTDIPAT
jgi:flavin prenyltransferase